MRVTRSEPRVRRRIREPETDSKRSLYVCLHLQTNTNVILPLGIKRIYQSGRVFLRFPFAQFKIWVVPDPCLSRRNTCHDVTPTHPLCQPRSIFLLPVPIFICWEDLNLPVQLFLLPILTSSPSQHHPIPPYTLRSVSYSPNSSVFSCLSSHLPPSLQWPSISFFHPDAPVWQTLTWPSIPSKEPFLTYYLHLRAPPPENGILLPVQNSTREPVTNLCTYLLMYLWPSLAWEHLEPGSISMHSHSPGLSTVCWMNTSINQSISQSIRIELWLFFLSGRLLELRHL